MLIPISNYKDLRGEILGLILHFYATVILCAVH